MGRQASDPATRLPHVCLTPLTCSPPPGHTHTHAPPAAAEAGFIDISVKPFHTVLQEVAHPSGDPRKAETLKHKLLIATARLPDADPNPPPPEAKSGGGADGARGDGDAPAAKRERTAE